MVKAVHDVPESQRMFVVSRGLGPCGIHSCGNQGRLLLFGAVWPSQRGSAALRCPRHPPPPAVPSPVPQPPPNSQLCHSMAFNYSYFFRGHAITPEVLKRALQSAGGGGCLRIR